MALLERLTRGETPIILLHGWQAALNEFARGKLSKQEIKNNYNIDSEDSVGLAILALIENETGSTAKLLKAWEINDVLILHSSPDTPNFYPLKSDVSTRLMNG